ncbi:hypothetical protein CC86DRAFT_344135 [Ophiobolus disseminans]|uniref:Zn(2)-C6 fungal-type domain-containing protein n=1 Tax=Ophiobolus disseminans TaxID=1469910 RepID=A0A6A7A8V4_9PLEO|nr:hypothetical protein CC86DRAFT_344135 [Ophiobolus disseminans]
MADDTMPPRPNCEFDFNLPHGIDTEEAMDVDNDPQQNNEESTDDPMDDLFNDPEPDDVIGADDQHDALNYKTFEAGFSDDEGGTEVFDRSWTVHQARKAPPKQKKSPRRSEDDDGDNESSPKLKKPRKSLFGGPVEERETAALEDHVPNAHSVSGLDVRQRMSSLNLDQQEAQDERPFHLGFGLGSSERGSMSPGPSRAPSEDSVFIPRDNQPVYPLRQNINRKKAMTHIDTDKTGNYDPSHNAKMKALRIQKAKAAKAAKKKAKGKGKAQVEPKEHDIKLIVKLRFKAFGNVRNYTNDEDNWPDGWSEVNSDYENEAKEYRNFYRRNTPDLDPQLPIEDPRSAARDLTGYPAARGCKHCLEHKRNCTMVEGDAYPCDQCDDEDNDCIPILEPLVKGGCKQCIDDGQDSCSFEDDPDKAVCDHCSEQEYICEALPPRGYKTPRTSIDDIMYSSTRKHIQCTYCRVEKKRCSLKKKTDKPPCKHCKNHGIGCTFYDLPKTARESKAAARQKAALGPTDGDAPEVSKPGSDFFSTEDLEDMMREDEEVFSREPTPEIEMEDNAGNKGPLTKIKTCFAHPMRFNVELENTTDCNFCEFPLFAFVGHFEREVHVIQWYSGLGYTETGGGFCEGKGVTQMCTDCTVARLQVICCPNHEFQSVFEGDDAPPDFDAMATEIMTAEPASAEFRYQLQRWCAMCFSAATWGCATVQPSLANDEETVGCGLRLCDTCAVTLRDVHDWDLEQMAAEMDWRPKTKEEDEQTGNLAGQARADVGLLRSSGLLMKNMGAADDDEA